MRELPPIAWRAVLAGGAIAVAVSLLLSLGPAPVPAPFLAIAAGAAVAGALAPSRSGFHGGLVAALWIAAEALAEPLRPAAADVVTDLAQTLLADVVRLAFGVGFGWLGGRARR